MHTLALLNQIVLALIMLVALFVLISFLPIEGGYTFRIVKSGSMEPVIQVGSVVATIPRSEYRVGEMVTFLNSNVGTPTTHRITRIEEGNSERLFTTKGDANKAIDLERVSESQVLGKVFLIIPYAGYVAHFMQTTYGVTLVITLFLAWLILPTVTGRVGSEEKRKKQKIEVVSKEKTWNNQKLF